MNYCKDMDCLGCAELLEKLLAENDKVLKLSHDIATLRAINADLLAACEAVLEELGEPAEWKDVGPDVHRQMIAIVAKAKGES